MLQLDYLILLVAGVIGVMSDQRLAWGVLGFWAFIKLLGVTL